MQVMQVMDLVIVLIACGFVFLIIPWVLVVAKIVAVTIVGAVLGIVALVLYQIEKPGDGG